MEEGERGWRWCHHIASQHPKRWPTEVNKKELVASEVGETWEALCSPTPHLLFHVLQAMQVWVTVQMWPCCLSVP